MTKLQRWGTDQWFPEVRDIMGDGSACDYKEAAQWRFLCCQNSSVS